ncbi:hypothetical protein [Mesorhizobium sp. M0684]|uniref:hypothetical protein n=1 Tax=unclassified Mesorhizobium TaxID=325217 RepID=UPI00333AE466
MRDEIDEFVELSALLTGQYNIVIDPEDATLARPIAAEYRRRLFSVLPDGLRVLIDAYKSITSIEPKPKIDDLLLSALKATQGYKNNEFVAKQIVNIWYFSQFKAEAMGELLDGGYYEEGLVWPLIKAHPIGFSNQPHGYWTKQP